MYSRSILAVAGTSRVGRYVVGIFDNECLFSLACTIEVGLCDLVDKSRESRCSVHKESIECLKHVHVATLLPWGVF